MINPKTKSHVNYLLFFVICFLFTLTISAIENTNKAIEKLLLTQEKIIPSDQAFKLKVKFEGKEIKFSWDIEENCYLYLDKFSFFSRKVGNYYRPSFPKGKVLEDEYFGEVEVFYTNLVIFIDLKNKNPKKLKLTYQGCNETGYCYPPVKKLLRFFTGEKGIIIEAI